MSILKINPTFEVRNKANIKNNQKLMPNAVFN